MRIHTSIESALKGGANEWKGENLPGCVLMEVRDRLNENIQ